MNPINKKVFVNFLAFFIISAGVNCNKISLRSLSAGDVVNDINLDQLTSELAGNFFNNETAKKYTKNKSGDYLGSHNSLTFDNCNKSGRSHYFPNIEVEATKKIRFDESKLNASVLGIEDRYINDNYSCVSVKNCIIKNDRSISINLRTPENFPNVKQWIKKSGLSGAWKKHETSYVSSIQTGDCVSQILVYEKDQWLIAHYETKTPIYQGRIFSASHNATLENWANDLLKNSNQTLVNIQWKNKNRIFNQFNNAAIVSLKLKLLPKISSLS